MFVTRSFFKLFPLFVLLVGESVAEPPSSPVVFRHSLGYDKTYDNDSSENTTYPNILPGTFYVYWIIYPVLLALCTFGNILNIVILASEKDKRSTTVYLLTCAFSDCLTLWFSCPEYILSVKRKESKHRSNVTLGNFSPFLQWGLAVFPCYSDWILLVFSLERLLVVTKPFVFRGQVITAKSAFWVAAVIMFLSGLSGLYSIVEGSFLRWNPHLYDGIHWPTWLTNWTILQGIFEILSVVLMFFILLGINIVIVVTLHRQRNTEPSLMRRLQDGQKGHNSNFVLFGCAAIYLTTQFPVMVHLCLSGAAAPPLGIYDYSSRNIVEPIVQTLFLTNYSLNFFLYFAVSKKFRQQGRVTLERLLAVSWVCPCVVQEKPVKGNRHFSTDSGIELVELNK